jgi:hypothetical protein
VISESQPAAGAPRRERTGGAEGNARLTAATAVVLLALLTVEALTLLSLQSFLSWHIFVGMLLLPVVALKLASTGHRFLRYYAGRRDYVSAGPPILVLRMLAPLLIATTIALFTTGVLLAALGPGSGVVLKLHQASFVVWAGALSLHVLAHALRVPRLVGPDLHGGRGVQSAGLRLALVAGAVATGLVVALATLPWIEPWTSRIGGH